MVLPAVALRLTGVPTHRVEGPLIVVVVGVNAVIFCEAEAVQLAVLVTITL